MKKTITTTLMALLLCITMVFGLTACTSQDDIDNAVNSAMSDLNDKISKLEGQIADLEDQIEALEFELAKNACAKGEHVWDGESEVKYSWSGDMAKCYALFDCIYCDGEGSAESVNITVDEDGNPVAEFDGGFPSDTFLPPTITGAAFNTDSEGYDEATNTFTVSEENSFVITFTGENLDKLSQEIDYIVGIKKNGYWYIFDYVYNTDYDISTVSKNAITYTIDYKLMVRIFRNLDPIDEFALIDVNTKEAIELSIVEVNLTAQQGDTPTDE